MCGPFLANVVPLWYLTEEGHSGAEKIICKVVARLAIIAEGRYYLYKQRGWLLYAEYQCCNRQHHRIAETDIYQQAISQQLMAKRIIEGTVAGLHIMD